MLSSQAVRDQRAIPQVGEVLCGIYRLDRVLGWGAVGIVFAAWHLSRGHPCAVKLLHPNFVDHPDVRERFRREAQSASKLNHPNIIQVLDFHEDDSGWPLLAMEFLRGENLRQRLGRGPLPLPETARVFAQLCAAMACAHRSGIVHRDLKPENIFLTRAPGDVAEVVKVLDFGISKITDHPEITALHALLGSPSYMSPEQARGEARITDARGDIFSLGLVLFECLTGRKAFAATDPEQKRRLILAGAVPSLREIQPGLPPALDQVVHKACAVDPAARYQSATALYEALLQALGPPPSSAATPTRQVSVPRAEAAATVVLPAAVLPAPVPASAAQATQLSAPALASAAQATQLSAPALALPSQATQPPEIEATVAVGSASTLPEQFEGTSLVTPSAQTPLSWVLARLGALLSGHPRAVRLLGQAGELIRGRELLVLLPLIFVALFGLLLVWAYIDARLSAPKQGSGVLPPRLQVR
jgi:serine/threonine-protein kinase